jgi:hypothetical protein
MMQPGMHWQDSQTSRHPKQLWKMTNLKKKFPTNQSRQPTQKTYTRDIRTEKI